MIVTEAVREFAEVTGQPVADLSQATSIIRVSHQPDFLAGLNTMGPILLLSSIASSRTPIVYMSVDYVPASTKRLLWAELPMGLSAKAVVHAFVSPQVASRNVLVVAMHPPSRPDIDRWVRALHSSAVATASDIRKHGVWTHSRQEISELLAELHEVWKNLAIRSPSWPMFSAALNLEVLNRILHDKIGAMSGCRYLALAASRHDMILRDDLTGLGVGGEHDWWLTCSSCTARMDACWAFDSRLALGRCETCGRQVQAEVDLTDVVSHGVPLVIPRVTADVALELASAPGSIHGSYAGSLGHLFHTRTILAGSAVASPPELVWDPLGLLVDDQQKVPDGAGADLLARGRAPLVIYYLLFGPGALTSALAAGSRPGPNGNQEPITRLTS